MEITLKVIIIIIVQQSNTKVQFDEIYPSDMHVKFKDCDSGRKKELWR